MAIENKTRECPYCKEEIQADAIKCKHCGSILPATKPPHGGICPYCKEEIKEDAIKCKHCKTMLIAQEDCECNERTGISALINPNIQVVDTDSFYPDESFEQSETVQRRFPSTLPKCRWVRRICGSSLPGYPPIYCYDYICNYGGNDIVVISRFIA